ncbi:hypothetical protein [Burkholderia sp. Ac-20353]|uniref:hypothetical protein n=1 Tax=Burkholderia sp. Ac-20353 TaxID=2703894 RepID=UPI00197BEB25|nr:hypothetical protein [Burkholderia sp. Ac-20353]MBN3791840.1 hypothetical protein [Burkholderia sp. Ac-20353]
MHKYPERLLDWSGDKAGGVKKLFYGGSGRPSGGVIKTRLLERLSHWARDIASGNEDTPKAVLLIGGPGNGKTEAIEYTIGELDAAMRLDGALLAEFADSYSGEAGMPGRLVRARRTKFPDRSQISEIAIVQDGSEGEGDDSTTPAEHLCNDIRRLLEDRKGYVYMACVNRGVLDDALILSTERGESDVGELIKQVVQSASPGAKGIDCWPLDAYPGFAVWPMDVESLVDESNESTSAARQILDVAIREQDWPEFGHCDAGDHCPFCTNRKLLAGEPHRSSYIRMLRWFELASGKRWNFRDLFSLTAFMLAGTTESAASGGYRPCSWAASLLFPKERDPIKAETKRIRGLFKLVSTQYQHALFGEWPVEKAVALRNDIKDLKLDGHPVFAGLLQFLILDKRRESTTTLRTQLVGMSSYLDPAFASPNLNVAVSANTTIKFEELDRRFSLSIKDARIFLQKYQCLSVLEIDLFKVLESADTYLSDESIWRRKPAVAGRIQAFIRLVACRIARRSIGVRSGITKDSDVLGEFNQILNGSISALQLATQQVEGLLNKDRRFLVSLNTTFGEPLPPPERRVMLTTDIQKVRPMPMPPDGNRPRSPVRFLSVGTGRTAQPVALTYELFKATKSLRKGMVPASLPRSVVALLDTTRAKLAGAVVRNEEALEGSEIRLGIRDDVIVRNFGTFLVHKEKA